MDTQFAVQEISLAGWGNDPIHVGVPQRVFGELLKLAIPTVENYHSDIYWDAMWLNETIQRGTEGLTFWYGVRDNGTHTITRSGLLDAVLNCWPGIQLYSIAVVNNDGMWVMLISRSQ